MNTYLLLRQILPPVITAAIIVFAYLVHDHISKAPRPPGADPWHDERQTHTHIWGLILGFGAMALFWDLVFATESFVRSLITPLVRAIVG